MLCQIFHAIPVRHVVDPSETASSNPV